VFYASWYKKGITHSNSPPFKRKQQLSIKIRISTKIWCARRLPRSLMHMHGKGQFVIQKKLSITVTITISLLWTSLPKVLVKCLCWECLKPDGRSETSRSKLSMNYPSKSQWKINLDGFNIRWYMTFYPLTTNFTKWIWKHLGAVIVVATPTKIYTKILHLLYECPRTQTF